MKPDASIAYPTCIRCHFPAKLGQKLGLVESLALTVGKFSTSRKQIAANFLIKTCRGWSCRVGLRQQNLALNKQDAFDLERHQSREATCLTPTVQWKVRKMVRIQLILWITRGQSNLTKSASRGPIPRLGVTPGGRKLYHWIPGVGFPISVP